MLLLSSFYLNKKDGKRGLDRDQELELEVIMQRVIDTHIHLAVDWREGESGLKNSWLPGEGEGSSTAGSIRHCFVSVGSLLLPIHYGFE